MSGPDVVNHPPHYTSHASGIECLQVTRGLPFTLGSAVKYVWRAELKGAHLEDLRKAAFYLEDWLGHEGEHAQIPGRVSMLLAIVEAAEVEIYGGDHPRPCFFHFMARGVIDKALVEVQMMIDQEEIPR